MNLNLNPIWEDRKKCPCYFRRDSRENPRDLNMCRTGRSAALSRRHKSMPPIRVLMKRESMKLVMQQRKFTLKHSNMNQSTLCLYSNFSMIDIFIYRKFFVTLTVLFSVTRTVTSVRPYCGTVHFMGGVVPVKSWRWSVKICHNRRLYLCLTFNNLSKLVHKSSS